MHHIQVVRESGRLDPAANGPIAANLILQRRILQIRVLAVLAVERVAQQTRRFAVEGVEELQAAAGSALGVLRPELE
jgi:hypothetical protein